MSDEREARALAAGETIEIKGKDGETKEYRLRPIVVQHLSDLERDALRYYKRSYLQTFADNADLLTDGKELVRAKMEEVAKWDLRDLPKKEAYDSSRVPVNGKVQRWIKAMFGEVPETEAGRHALLNTALDQGKITPAKLKDMTGKGPLKGSVRFDQWWVTACVEGMVSWIVSSLRYDHPEMGKREVANWPPGKMAEAARLVESITSAQLGNT